MSMSSADIRKQMNQQVAGLAEMMLPAANGVNKRVPILPQPKPGSDSGEFEWSELARVVLEAEIQDNIMNLTHEEQKRRKEEALLREGKEIPAPYEDLWDSSAHMRALAGRMGCHIDDLLGVKAGIDPLVWETKRWERIVRIESVRDKMKSWNELEAIAVQMLIQRVETGRVVDEDKLLAIANTAARVTQVTQNGSGPTGPGASSVNVQINQIGMNPQGDLPGPGNLGPITLTLSHRVVGQLKQQKEQREDSYLESIEMLGSKDVPDLIKTIEGEKVK